MATRLGAAQSRNQGSISGRSTDFLPRHSVQTGSYATQLYDTGKYFLGVKRQKREAHHSPPYSAEVKNAWSYTPALTYVFIAWCLVKHTDNFIFIFT
jgi:hypothetical protein